VEEALNVTPPAAGESVARARRALGLWLGAACGLALAFAADGPAMAPLRPLHDSSLSHLLRHTVRWLGIGYAQGVVLLLVIGAAAIWRHRAAVAGAWALLALAVSGLAADVVKVLVHRPRPWASLPPPESWVGYLRMHELQSFPSGESTTSFAIAMVLGDAFPRLRIPLMLAASVVAAARVLVGDHFPSDVWAGAMLGIAVGQWTTRLARRRAGRGSGAQA
jgi:membrane-associated phospholipid phosphatase